MFRELRWSKISSNDELSLILKVFDLGSCYKASWDFEFLLSEPFKELVFNRFAILYYTQICVDLNNFLSEFDISCIL